MAERPTMEELLWTVVNTARDVLEFVVGFVLLLYFGRL
jgi:hypothetical protein